MSIKGDPMPDQMYQRGKRGIYYANCRFLGVYIRDCLGTSDKRLAERRLAELKFAVERGDYSAWKKNFRTVSEEYKDTRYQYIVNLHLLPHFGGMLIGEINEYEVYKYYEQKRHLPKSSLMKHFQVLKSIVTLANRDFKLPKIDFANRGKRFDETQILNEAQVLEVAGRVYEPYRHICLISIYSGLRLGDVVGLKKRAVDMKAGWMVLTQQKTGNPVSVPLHPKLKDVFQGLKVWPMQEQDRFFPDAKMKAVSTAVKKAFRKSGIPWGSFHHFRHFAACHLIVNGVGVEVVQKILGHTSIQTTMRYARFKREVIHDAMTTAFAGGDANSITKKISGR